MKTEEFTRKDGTKGVNYTLEAGDEVISKYKSVSVKDNAFIKEGKAVPIKNYSLGVQLKDGKEIYLRLTAGQVKSLNKAGDLTGKTLVAYEYNHAKYGKFIGVKVKA